MQAREGNCIDARQGKGWREKASAGKVSHDTTLMFQFNEAVVSNIKSKEFQHLNGKTVKVDGADWQDGTQPIYGLPIH